MVPNRFDITHVVHKNEFFFISVWNICNNFWTIWGKFLKRENTTLQQLSDFILISNTSFTVLPPFIKLSTQKSLSVTAEPMGYESASSRAIWCKHLVWGCYEVIDGMITASISEANPKICDWAHIWSFICWICDDAALWQRRLRNHPGNTVPIPFEGAMRSWILDSTSKCDCKRSKFSISLAIGEAT